jgi:hypothetical protein
MIFNNQAVSWQSMALRGKAMGRADNSFQGYKGW